MDIKYNIDTDTAKKDTLFKRKRIRIFKRAQKISSFEIFTYSIF